MKSYQNQYVYGNTAAKVYRHEVLTNDEKKDKIRKSKREALIYKMNLILTMLVIFGMITGILTQYSSVSYKQDKLKKIEKEIKLVHDELYDSKLAIAESMNTEKVKRIATEKLGMVKAADYQIIYINIPKENYTVKY